MHSVNECSKSGRQVPKGHALHVFEFWFRRSPAPQTIDVVVVSVVVLAVVMVAVTVVAVTVVAVVVVSVVVVVVMNGLSNMPWSMTTNVTVSVTPAWPKPQYPQWPPHFPRHTC